MNSARTVRRPVRARDILLAALALLCVGCAGSTSSARAQSDVLRLTVLHTGNLNGRMRPAAAVRAHHDRIQREVGRVLLVDTGNAMLRSEQAFDHASGSESFSVNALNSLGYDASVLGAAELDRPAQQLTASLREARRG